MKSTFCFSLKVRCEKCGKEEEKDLGKYDIYEKAYVNFDLSKRIPIFFLCTPHGWKEVEGMALCPDCYEKIRYSQWKAHQDFHEFMFGYRPE